MRMRYIIHNKRSGQLYGMFLHPVTRQRVYRSIGTSDELAAARTSQALQQFIKDESWHSPAKVREAVKIDAVAAKLFYDPLKPHDYSFAAHGTYVQWSTQEDDEWVEELIEVEEAIKRARQIEQENIELKLKVAQQEIEIQALTEKCGPVNVSTKTFADAAKAYAEWGRAQGGRGKRPWSKDHARKRPAAVEFWREQLQAESLADIRLDRVESVLSVLKKTRAPGTVANYAEAICAFCDWCVDRGYITKDPLSLLGHFDRTAETERIALTPAQAQNLVLKCRPQRKLLYLTALCSGWRANELRLTECRHLLEHGLKIPSHNAKSRKRDFQPLPEFLVALLRREAEGKQPTDKLLDVPLHLERGFDADLERAGITKTGGLCFACLRTTYLTMVDGTAASPGVAQRLGRHSTPQITYDRYVKARSSELGATVEQVGALVRGSSAGTSARPA